ncbi:SGNH/GDSL hydrolase family protein [Alkalihalobacillus sp. FSL W8-0930]
MLKQDDTFVLIGDSITENGRFEDPQGIGIGYAALIHDYLMVKHPELHLAIYNRGISGNRVTDLEDRWQQDVLDLNPNWVSISIGVNDAWSQTKHPDRDQVYPELFEEIYDRLIRYTLEKTNARLILMEPTIIKEELDSEENQTLKPYIEAVHRLAIKYDAILVPTNQVFQTYLEAESNVPVTTDGVHMNSKGDVLMATAWIDAFNQSDNKQ